MKRGLSLRQRILLVFTGLALAGGAALTLIAGTRLEAATVRFFTQDLQNRAITAASSLGVDIESEGGSSLQTRIDALSQRTGYDYLVVDSRGRLAIPQAAPDYLVALPQALFQDALRDSVSVHTSPDAFGAQRASAAVPIKHDEDALGFLIVSAPMTRAYEEVRAQWLALLAVALPVIVLVAAASLWVGQSIVRPLSQLEESALKMASGRLDTRITINASHEIGALADAFNIMAERVEALVGQQRSFVSNAAHELRRPLMAMRLRLEGLEGSTLSPEERTVYLRELTAETTRMAGLVSSLLTLARLDERHRSDVPEPFDTVALLQDSARQWRIQTQRAGLEFRAALPADLPPLPLSAEELHIILDNLLNNAVKYTAHGSVSLTVQANAHNLIIEVSDTGEGFDAVEQARLFERFFRASRERDGFVEGTGLGLAIVHTLVAQVGGRISATSAGHGHGATFRVELPLQSSQRMS
ncbi:MAG TPA: HAMP domain-containing sensor histidine kinase [Candidatus Limnocylindrales bacterium]|nr:HAMP domain-containing sensor histidine kinase [Candidatus Limnocylindrales bacterium]